jgi:hypothetical protein
MFGLVNGHAISRGVVDLLHPSVGASGVAAHVTDVALQEEILITRCQLDLYQSGYDAESASFEF